MSFEHTTQEFPSLAGQKTPEQLQQIREEREQREAYKAAFLAEQKKTNDKDAAIAFDRAVLRAEEITSQEVIAAIMDANPNFSEYQAKTLYREKVREIVAIERFRQSFFGSPDKQRAAFGHVKL
jgi:hypothetical protein